MTSAFEGWLGSSAVDALFEPRALVQAMLDFEVALARAQAAEGLVPDSAARAIAAACRVERFDAPALVSAAARAGSLAIPLLGALRQALAPEAAGHVHRGATSQDVIDTAWALQTRCALALIDRDVEVLADALLALAERDGDAPLLGRTLLQPAAVISFGFKVAGWVAPLLRSRARLHAAGAAALQLQLGGAVGTRAALGERADAIAQRMAQALQLRNAPAWHTQRDQPAALGAALGVLAGCAAKIGRDWALMAQGEVGELAEGASGGSSAMPHKRNPVAALRALAATQRVPPRVAALLASMAHEHERALGAWQAELAEWPGLLSATHAAVQALAGATPQLRIDTARMRANIDQARLFDADAAESARAQARHQLAALRRDTAALHAPWTAFLPAAQESPP